MLPPVYATLRADAAVAAIVGAAPARVYRHGDAPQNADRPYVTWQVVFGLPELNLSDPPPTDRITLQLDCWHPEDDGVEVLAKAVRDALEPHAHMTGIILNDRDRETRLYRLGLQFDWFWDRP